jgi:hypothetical protein
MNTPLSSAVPAKNSGLAISSLVLGTLSLIFLMLCIGFLFAIPAVICGHVALGRIKRSSGGLVGHGLATAGLITGYITLALSVVVVPFLAAIAVPNFIQARDTARKNVCLTNLRMIDGAKQQWALENNKTATDTPTAADLDKYLPSGVTFDSLHCPADGVYTINSANESPTCSVSNHVLNFRQSYTPATPPPIRQFNPPITIERPTNLFTIRSNMMGNRLQTQAMLEKNRCQMNLRMIQSAKRMWAMKYHKQNTDIPTLYELVPFLPGRRLPECPDGGTYEFNSVRNAPTCSYPDHQLPKIPNSTGREGALAPPPSAR